MTREELMRAELQDTDHVRGDIEKAKVILVEYGDYDCIFCARHHATMMEVMNTYGEDVAWVYRHFPLPSHGGAAPEAIAAECADEQGKFWELTDMLFAEQEGRSDNFYNEAADALDIDRDALDECIRNETHADKVNADIALGQMAGVTGTPTTFVNGTMVYGAVSPDILKTIIDAEIAQ